MSSYNIDKAVNRILKHKSLDLRAIELFVLSVALHAGESKSFVTGHKSKNDLDSLSLNVSKRTLRDARFLAGMKFLEGIEAEWKAKNPSEKATLERMAQIPRFKLIYNRVIIGAGSWYKMRYSTSLAKFEEDVERWIREATDVAHVIQFSTIFPPDLQKPRQRGGVKMAIELITDDQTLRAYFETRVRSTRLEDEWKRLKSAAPFLYLIYLQKYNFGLEGVRTRSFPQQWRNRAKDRKHIEDWFSSYNYLARHLGSRGYKYTLLKASNGFHESTLKIEPLRMSSPKERKVIEAIGRYGNG